MMSDQELTFCAGTAKTASSSTKRNSDTINGESSRFID